MRVTIFTAYDPVAGDFTEPVEIDVPAPPVSGDECLAAYEVEDTPEGQALNAWAKEHFGPHAKTESVVVKAADDEPMLVGCEFAVKESR